MILSNVRDDSQLDVISILVNFVCESGPIMASYDFLYAVRVMFESNPI